MIKLRIVFKAYNKELINLAIDELRRNLIEKQYEICGVVSLPTRIKRFCVLRSPHVDKDSREHFEIRIFKRFVDIKINSFNTLEALFKLEFPAGISCSLKLLEVLNV